ncbi:zinc-finger domain-containing protein [Roseospira marina]|uniref:Zinc-finger domain-containing protein n=1 Tax=Roseospira marina TaxID=140057 RepID=A0A5M6IE76_9PROT|nr:zinc-finger domain-containing protein [Roseospira marina]KAA5606267.1 zinc-finger domain-containing protein [Roseospira marina]MBB4314423.1 putative Zn-finger protein [Roseospira marina]MBB5087583.1 putative Zn-finger protein [Roseospira marina]
MAHTPTYPVTETVETTNPEVACDGIGTALGHPRVFLHIKPGETDVVCPYCSRRFVLTAGATAAAH